MRNRCFLAVLLLISTAALRAQPAAADGGEIERLVREGQVEALEARLRQASRPDDLQLLAHAATNAAARERTDEARTKGFVAAERRFLSWISGAERNTTADERQRKVAVSAARAAYGGMLLSRWAARDLDEWELTLGRGVDPARVRPLLLKSRELFTQILAELEPLQREIDEARPDSEDGLLLSGVLEDVARLVRDARFNQAWANLYLALLESKDAKLREGALQAADGGFSGLLEWRGLDGAGQARVRVGLAVVQRELARFDAALTRLGEAAKAAAGTPLETQLQYERGRTLAAAGRLGEARQALQPLAARGEDPQAVDEPLRFYLNLALLWDAHIDLLESVQLARAARGAAPPSPRSTKLREQGFQKLGRLAARGGAWPRLAQYYAEPVLDPAAPPKDQSAIELLFLGRKLLAAEKLPEAAARLREASQRREASAAVTAEALLELGTCLVRQNDRRAGAEIFARLARDYRQHERAPAAASMAQSLWAQIAQESGATADYLALADCLQVIVRNYPEHPQRSEAAWLWPAALQAAGKFTAAAEQFGNVAANSPHWDDAQHRRLLCLRSALEADRAQLAPDEYRRRAERLVGELRTFAQQAERRAATASSRSSAIGDQPGEALLGAVELLISPDLARYDDALSLLDENRARVESPALAGRALAARIAALFGLGRLESAAGEVDRFVKSVTPDVAAGTLARLALGLEQETQRLAQAGQAADARRLAEQALPVFELLERWAATDRTRAALLESVRFGLASLRLQSGQADGALLLTQGLVSAGSRDGELLRLHARVLSALSERDASQIAAAREAWAALLRDGGLRSRAPARYWEARCEFLSLLLREGRGDEVARAIQQERAWIPDLGGPPWSERLERLAIEAGAPPAATPTPD